MNFVTNNIIFASYSYVHTQGRMKPLLNILIPVVILMFLDKTLGQHNRYFMEKYKEAIQKYLMTGHEDGWDHCDILSANPYYNGMPQISMDLENIKMLNVKNAFASSHCLLVNYHISDEASLNTLIDFGQNAIQHIRLAVIINMISGITLNMVKNSTKIPFVVAANLDNGEEFLCPVLGEAISYLKQEFCKSSFISYKNRKLRIALVGPMPEFIFRNFKIDGTSFGLMNMLAKKLNFIPRLKVPGTMEQAVVQVRIIFDF